MDAQNGYFERLLAEARLASSHLPKLGPQSQFLENRTPVRSRALTVVAPRVPPAAASMALDLRGVHREGARRRRLLPFCAPEGWIGR